MIGIRNGRWGERRNDRSHTCAGRCGATALRRRLGRQLRQRRRDRFVHGGDRVARSKTSLCAMRSSKLWDGARGEAVPTERVAAGKYAHTGNYDW